MAGETRGLSFNQLDAFSRARENADSAFRQRLPAPEPVPAALQLQPAQLPPAPETLGEVRQEQLSLGGSPARLPDAGQFLRPSTNGQAFVNRGPTFQERLATFQSTQAPQNNAVQQSQLRLSQLESRANGLELNARQAAQLAAGSGSGAIGQEARARAAGLAQAAQAAREQLIAQQTATNQLVLGDVNNAAQLQQTDAQIAGQQAIAQDRLALQGQGQQNELTLGRERLAQQERSQALEADQQERQLRLQGILNLDVEELRQLGLNEQAARQFEITQQRARAEEVQRRQQAVFSAQRSLNTVIPDELAIDPVTRQPDPERQNNLQLLRRAYLQLISEGTPPGEALQQAFQLTPEQLTTEGQ